MLPAAGTGRHDDGVERTDMSRTGTLTAAAMMAVTVALCAAGCGIGWQDHTISQVSVDDMSCF